MKVILKQGLSIWLAVALAFTTALGYPVSGGNAHAHAAEPAMLAGAEIADDEDSASKVSFFGISGIPLESSGIDASTVGTMAPKLVPDKNALYLPASADITALPYSLAPEGNEPDPGYDDPPSDDGSSGEPPTQGDPSGQTPAQGDTAGQTPAQGDPQDQPAGGSEDTTKGQPAEGDEGDAGDPAADYGVDALFTGRAGTLDLSAIEPSVDDMGNSRWLLGFRWDDQAPVVYVHVYWDGDASTGATESQVPALFLTTTNGLDWVEADKANRDEGGSIALVGADATIEYAGELAQLKGRGHSSWTCAKKPYQIKLAKKASLVDGAKQSKTWILLAGAYDQSLVRNAVAMSMGQACGLEFTPKFRQVNLYIDGAYRGVYLLIEKVQVDSSRIDIVDLEKANENANPGVDLDAIEPVVLEGEAAAQFSGVATASYVPNMKSPEDITGGYVLEMEIDSRMAEEKSYFQTSYGTCYVIKYPELASRDEVAYISGYVQEFEDALHSPDGMFDDFMRYDEYIDEQSFAAYYCLQETLGNHDAFKSSTYLYKDSNIVSNDGRLKAGPLWDCDRTLRSVKLDLVEYEDPTAILVADPNRSGVKPQLICSLLSQTGFQKAVKDAYAKTVRPQADIMAKEGIVRLADELKTSSSLDFARWSVARANGEKPYGGGYVSDLGDWPGAVATAVDYLQTRMVALDSKIGIPIELEVKPDPNPEPEPIPEKATFERIAGNTRYSTMSAVNKLAFSHGSTQTAIVASGEAFPDAQAAASLAGMLRCPIILTASQSLSKEASAELKRLGVTRVYIAGGTAAVDSNVEKAVKSLGVKSVVRLAGADRYATCLSIYRMGCSVGAWSDTCIVASGSTFADALSIGPYAFASKSPIFLTQSGKLDSQALAAIKSGGFKKVLVLGGSAAVDFNAVASSLGKGYAYVRLSGADRYSTSEAICAWETGANAKAAFQPDDSAKLSYTGMALADGRGFADALVAAPCFGARLSVVQLVDESLATRSRAASILKAHGMEIGNGYVVGGIAAVSDTVKKWFIP